jgi:hypothetical protein
LRHKSHLGDVKYKFEFDLFGVGADVGQTTIRFRHIYGEWGMLLAGQTNTVFMDLDVFPNTIDYWDPPEWSCTAMFKIRLTRYRMDNSHFAIAIERPGNDVDTGTIRELDPELGANPQNDEKLSILWRTTTRAAAGGMPSSPAFFGRSSSTARTRPITNQKAGNWVAA